MLMGMPVFASALSTVTTALPLWLTTTVALNQFGVIFAVSLSVSFVYALFMLIPLLAMLGPEKTFLSTTKSALIHRFLGTRLSRAALASGTVLFLMVRLLGHFTAEAHGVTVATHCLSLCLATDSQFVCVTSIRRRVLAAPYE